MHVAQHTAPAAPCLMHTCIRFLVGFRPVEVSFCDIWPPDTHLANLALGHLPVAGVQDDHLHPTCLAVRYEVGDSAVGANPQPLYKLKTSSGHCVSNFQCKQWLPALSPGLGPQSRACAAHALGAGWMSSDVRPPSLHRLQCQAKLSSDGVLLPSRPHRTPHAAKPQLVLRTVKCPQHDLAPYYDICSTPSRTGA
jgi:hypothetical protein